jgi:5'-nucleotidase
LAISSQSLFNAGWNGQGGLTGWRDHQEENATRPMNPGPAFEFVSRLLKINDDPPVKRTMVEVSLVSRQDPAVSLRLLNTMEAYGLARYFSRGLEHASYLGGANPVPVLESLKPRPHLFLSTRLRDVRQGLQGHFGAAHLEPFPAEPGPPVESADEAVTFAFDGDACIFGDQGEGLFLKGGLAAFNEHEMKHAAEPLSQGPLYGILMALGSLKSLFEEARRPAPFGLQLITARGFAGQKRVLRTLEGWGIRFDQTLFLSGSDKGPYLRRFRTFDDTLGNIRSARQHGVPAAHVPFGVKNVPSARRKKP